MGRGDAEARVRGHKTTEELSREYEGAKFGRCSSKGWGEELREISKEKKQGDETPWLVADSLTTGKRRVVKKEGASVLEGSEGGAKALSAFAKAGQEFGFELGAGVMHDRLCYVRASCRTYHPHHATRHPWLCAYSSQLGKEQGKGRKATGITR